MPDHSAGSGILVRALGNWTADRARDILGLPLKTLWPRHAVIGETPMDWRSPGVSSLTALLLVTVMGSASGQESSDPEMPESFREAGRLAEVEEVYRAASTPGT